MNDFIGGIEINSGEQQECRPFPDLQPEEQVMTLAEALNVPGAKATATNGCGEVVTVEYSVGLDNVPFWTWHTDPATRVETEHYWCDLDASLYLLGGVESDAAVWQRV